MAKPENTNPAPSSKILVMHFGDRLAHYAYRKNGKIEYVTLVKGPNEVDTSDLGFGDKLTADKFFEHPEIRVLSSPDAIFELVRMKPELIGEAQSVIGLVALSQICPMLAGAVRERIQTLRK